MEIKLNFKNGWAATLSSEGEDLIKCIVYNHAGDIIDCIVGSSEDVIDFLLFASRAQVGEDY